MLAVAIGVGGLVGSRLSQPSTPDRVTVRVIDDGAKGGPAVLLTEVVSLR
jgi:hypothetical protein